MENKTAEEIAFDLASAAIDMMAHHCPDTEQMMREAIERWKTWQLNVKARKTVRADRDEAPHRQGPHDDQCEFRRVQTNRCGCYSRRMESKREAAGTADEKPDGQAENVKVMAHPLAGANVERGVWVEIR